MMDRQPRDSNAGEIRDEPQIGGLEELLRQAGIRGEAPVDKWDPPYCGDIGLRIGADGIWSYMGSPIGRPRLVNLFARVLRRDADGSYFLVTPAEKVDVAVSDAPFLAIEMEVRGSGRSRDLIFRTNVDDVVMCGADHALRFVAELESGGLKPYVHVRGRLEALVVRSLTYDLLDMVEENDAGKTGVWSGGRFFEVGSS